MVIRSRFTNGWIIHLFHAKQLLPVVGAVPASLVRERLYFHPTGPSRLDFGTGKLFAVFHAAGSIFPNRGSKMLAESNPGSDLQKRGNPDKFLAPITRRRRG
jgi:hypothetical protein